jgi:hypothetical protein
MVEGDNKLWLVHLLIAIIALTCCELMKMRGLDNEKSHTLSQL